MSPVKKGAVKASSLEDHEARLKLVLNAAKVGTWEWNLQTNENIWSNELWSLYGLAHHSCKPSAETWLQTVHPDDRDSVNAKIRDAVRCGDELNLEWRFNSPRSPERWLMSRGRPERDKQGRIARYIGIVIDITARKRTEKALQTSETRYRHLYASMTDAFAATDMAGRIHEVNPAFKAMVGYTDAKLRQLTYKDLTPAKWHAFEARIVKEQIFPRGYSGVYEKEYRRRDGTVFPVELLTFLIRDDAGKPKGMWAIVRDITGRKQTEETIRRERELYMDLVNTQPTGMYRVRIFPPRTWKKDAWLSSRNTPYSFAFGNDRFYQILGIEKKTFERNPGILNELVHPDDKDGFAKLHAKVMARPVKSMWEGRLLVNGEVRWVHFESTPRPLAGGDVLWTGVLQDITDRKQAEAALRQSEEKYHLLFQNMTEGFALYELLFDKQGNPADWRILEINDAYTRHTGVARGRIVGRRISEVFPDAIPEYLPFFAKLVTTGTPANFQTYSKSVGRHHHVVTFPAGGHRFASLVEDITERKLVETALQESRTQYLNLVEGTPDLITRVDTKGRFLFVNHTALEIYGLAPEDCIGRLAFDFIHPEDREMTKAAFQTWLKSGKDVFSHENRMVDIAGQAHYIAWSIRAERGENGKVCGFASTGMDLTGRKQVEEALQNSESRYRELVDFAVDGILVGTHEGFITEANECICKLTGMKREELIGKHIRDLPFEPEGLAKNPLRFDLLQKCEIVVRERKIVRPDASEVVVEMHTKMMPDGSYQSIYHDITDRKQAEEQVRRFSMQLLIVREEERKSMSAVLHHDVGSLAVGISAHLDAMEQDIRAGKTGEALKWMKQTRKLFNESVARLKGMAIELRPPDLDVLGLCAALRQHFSLFTKHRGVRIHFRESMGRRRMSGTLATILFRVAQEALTNALKHGHAKKVDVGLHISKKKIHLSIHDNGNGFNPYSQSAQVPSKLGLLVMREMVSAAQGTFTIDSRKGKGTVVRASLPLDAARQAPAVKNTKKRSSGS